MQIEEMRKSSTDMNVIEITELNIPELLPYSELSEKQLYRYYEPNPGLFVAESPNVIERAVKAGYRPDSFLLERSQLKTDALRIIEDFPSVPVYVGEMSLLKKLTGFELTRGVLSLMRRRDLPDAVSLIQGKKRIAVLEDVMNPTNLGAIFRSAAALGVEAVLLTKGCTDPLYRRAARVSMGTVFQVPWCRFETDDWMGVLREQGFQTVAMALRHDTKELGDPHFKSIPRLAVVLGTEGEGLREDTISRCDDTVKIPMTNGVDSLNVAAASAVAFWELCGKDQR